MTPDSGARLTSDPGDVHIFTWLLKHPAPSPERVAAEVSRVLRRKESARIYHWHGATGGLPPRRPPPDTS